MMLLWDAYYYLLTLFNTSYLMIRTYFSKMSFLRRCNLYPSLPLVFFWEPDSAQALWRIHRRIGIALGWNNGMLPFSRPAIYWFNIGKTSVWSNFLRLFQECTLDTLNVIGTFICTQWDPFCTRPNILIECINLNDTRWPNQRKNILQQLFVQLSDNSIPTQLSPHTSRTQLFTVLDLLQWRWMAVRLHLPAE